MGAGLYSATVNPWPRTERLGRRTSLHVISDLVPRYSRRAQLHPIVHVGIEGFGPAVEFHEGCNTAAACEYRHGQCMHRRFRTIAPLCVSYSD